MSEKIKGSLLLTIAAIIWGSSFIVMKSAVDFLTPASLLFVRFGLASIFLAIIFFKKIKDYPKDRIIGGLFTGCCLFIAYYVQTWGLSYTSPGKNAFLTAVYCAIVPFLVWAIYRKKPDIYNFVAAFMCIAGVGCVSLDGQLTMNIGDVLTLCGGFLYAIHILMIKKFSKDVDGGVFTMFQFIGGTCLALLMALFVEDISVITQIQPSIFLQIFYLAFFATAVTMVCQTIGQNVVSECQASLILSLESVFGVLFSVLFYGEVLTLKVILGFVLIFIAIIISETKLSFIKKNKLVQTLLVLIIVFSGLNIQNVQAASVPIESPYAYVYDFTTGQELYQKNAHQKIYPASMTKVMTALVALENMKDMNTVVTITNEDLKGLWEAGASVANFVVGEKVTYGDLIYGIILPSGADACKATARVLFGSEKNMVAKMNEKAKALGLKNTHFENTTGLHHNNHYTSVHDMAIITKTALENQFFKKVFTSRSYKTQTTGHYMAASILKVYWRQRIGISHIKGCKTGYTDESKSCLTALVNSQGHELISVFAKAEGSGQYVKDAKTVIDYYNNNYKNITVYKKGDFVKTLDVEDGVKESYDVKIQSDVKVLMPKSTNEKDIQKEYVATKELVAPTKVIENIGSIKISYQDQELKNIPIVMNENIDATDFAKFCRYLKSNIVMIMSIIVFIIMVLVIWVRILKQKRRKKRIQKRK